MVNKSRAFVFFLTAAVIALTVFLYANDAVTNWWTNGTTGGGNAEFYQLSASSDGHILALGSRNGSHVLSCGTLNGTGWTGKLNEETLPEHFYIESIYAVSGEKALLLGYKTDGAGTISAVQIYVISDQGKVIEPLLSEDCKGTTAVEQRRSVCYSAFAHYNDKVYFLMWREGSCYLYELTEADMTVRMTGSFACESLRGAVILSDGKIAIAQDDGVISIFSSFGVHQYDLQVSGNVTALYAGVDSFYYVDNSTDTVNEVGQMEDEYYLLQKIPADTSLPLTVQPGGTILWLENGRLYHYDGAPVEVKGILYPAPWESWAYLSACLLGVLALAVCAVLLLCSKRQVSMLVRAGLCIAFSGIITLGVFKTYALPAVRNITMNNTQQTVESAASLGLRLAPDAMDGSDSVTKTVSQALADSGLYDAKVVLYRYTSGGYLVKDSTDETLEAGRRVVGKGLILSAKASGTISEIEDSLNGKICTAVASDSTNVLTVSVNLSTTEPLHEQEWVSIIRYTMISRLLMVLVLSIILLNVWSGVHRITKGVQLVTAGEYDVETKNPSGDELEGLAVSMNNMTRALQESVERSKHIDEVYMRFIPEETIQLLGVDKLEDVTRETVANHEMVVMSVRFHFPEEEISTEQLFSNINTVIQRTIFAAVAYAGNSFSFTRNSYIVVFPEEVMDMCGLAALAMEEAVDAINKERELHGHKPVSFKIAMDRGLVRMGIVGDDLHMVPTAASKCLEKNKKVLRLGRLLDSRTLFTEDVLEHMQDTKYRYIGQFSTGNEEFRLYELFEGDNYLVAQRKKDTKEDFDRALAAFYRRDFTQAKAILLHLARTGSGKDGAVRYYLNLADRYEQNAPERLLLGEGEVI